MWGSAVNIAYWVQRGSPLAGIYVTTRVYNTMRDVMDFVSAGEIDGEHGTETVWRLQGNHR